MTMMITMIMRQSNQSDDREDLAEHAANADVLLIGVLDARRLNVLLALFPRYQAIGAKIVMKMPRIPKIRIRVP